jgi:hypothetical protein
MKTIIVNYVDNKKLYIKSDSLLTVDIIDNYIDSVITGIEYIDNVIIKLLQDNTKIKIIRK